MLGAGGFGEVWLARHDSVASLCGAVKFFHGQQAQELMHESGLIDRVMSAGKHPNIVPLTNVGLKGRTPWLMYEYIPGGDLTQVILKWRSLSNEDRVIKATGVLCDLAAAVGHFHKLSPPVVHRDLKPANILYDPHSGMFRITDFGIGAIAAKSVALGETGKATLGAGRMLNPMHEAHSPIYSSPQQRLGKEPTPQDDIHALGVIAYQMIVGEVSHGPGADLDYELVTLGVRESLIELIRSCVAKDTGRRPANGVDLLHRVQTLSPTADRMAVKPAPLLTVSRNPIHGSVDVLTPRTNPLQFSVDEARLRKYSDRVKAISLKQEKYSRANYHPETEAELDPLPDEISGFNTIIGVLWGAVLLGVFLIVIGLKNPKLMYIGIADVVVFLVALVIAAARTPYAREMARRRRVLDSASERLDGLERRCKKKWAEYEAMFEALQLSIPKLIAKCGGLSSAYFQQRKDLEERAKATAREQHLRNHVIATSEIAGVGGKRKQLLGDNHIITAFDIARDKIQRISGFGPDLTASLMKWRDEVFNQFRFNPTVDIPETQLRQVAYQYAKEQEACWNDIEDQLRKLVELGAGFSRELDSLAPDLRKSVAHFLAARGNLELLESER